MRDAKGVQGYVNKVSRGAALVTWDGQRYANCEYCRELTVVPSPGKPSNRPAMAPEAIAEAHSLRQRIKTLESAGLHASAEALRQRLREL